MKKSVMGLGRLNLPITVVAESRLLTRCLAGSILEILGEPMHTLRTLVWAASAASFIAMGGAAFAQNITSGDVCFVNWNNPLSNDPKRDDVNRGALLIAVSGQEVSLHSLSGSEGMKAALPPPSLQGWTFVQKSPLQSTGDGYSFTYRSPKLGANILVTLARKDGALVMTMGQAERARNGTGIMRCQARSSLYPLAIR